MTRRLPWLQSIVVALVATGLTACGADAPGATGCRPAVVGATPSEGRDRSGWRFPGTCRGVWVPGLDDGFVPQGVAVRGGRAWVRGWLGPRIGQRRCRVEVVSLRTGRLLAGPRQIENCYHGSGLMLDEHGLWVTSSPRLFLLDPTSLSVRRTWALRQPVQGSFGLLDDRGRLGLGRFRGDVRQRHHHPGPPRIDWFGIEDLLARSSLGPADAVASRSIGRSAQGAVWGPWTAPAPGSRAAPTGAASGRAERGRARVRPRSRGHGPHR